MVSGASEEGLMLQIDNPSHLDPARRSVPAGLVLGTFAGVFASSYVNSFIAAVFGMFCGIVTITVLQTWLMSRAKERSAKRMEEIQDLRAIERDRQMAAAKASGAFDQFGTKIETE
jgi:hypothetical protein